MTTGERIGMIAMFSMAGVFLLCAVMAFLERGILLNNAYLYASKAERKKMNKKPYYQQSTIVFCILSANFLVIGLSLLLRNDKLLFVEIPLIAGAVVYAIASTAKINKRK